MTGIVEERPREKAEGASRKYVCFIVEKQVYAAPVTSVLEVVPMLDISPVFQTPAFVLGVVNLRGTIVAMVDIRHFFGLPPTRIGERSRMVVLHSRGITCGIVVDGLAKVRDIPDAAVSSPPSTMEGASAEYLSGVVQTPEHPLIVLNVDAVMNSEEIRSLEI